MFSIRRLASTRTLTHKEKWLVRTTSQTDQDEARYRGMQELTPDRIISLLEEPTDNRIPVYRDIRRRASIRYLIVALQQALTPLTRVNLIDILGERHAARAVPTIIDAFGVDPCSGVRSSRCRRAPAKIGKVSAGPALLDALRIEENDGTRQMLVLALGAVGYVPAVPSLIGLLKDPSGMVRGCAAWSLGALEAMESTDILGQALATGISPLLIRTQIADGA